MRKSPSKKAESPSALIDARIADLDDWRGETLSRVRALIKETVPEVVEEWKWRGTPTWYHNEGIICTGETYKDKVKIKPAPSPQSCPARVRRAQRRRR